MCNVDGNTHVREMEAVAQPNQADCDDVMCNQLFEVLSRLLEHQEQHNGLLRPVAGLKQIVCLEDGVMCPVREALVHAGRIEVPHRRARHDPDAKWTVQAKVQSCIGLLHEARLLGPALDAAINGNRADQPLHTELAREAQDNDVETDKGEVACPLAIMSGRIGVCSHGCRNEGIVGRKRVGEEEAGCHRIRGIWVDQVERNDCEAEEEREEPGMPYAHALELGEAAADCSAFGAAGRLL